LQGISGLPLRLFTVRDPLQAYVVTQKAIISNKRFAKFLRN